MLDLVASLITVNYCLLAIILQARFYLYLPKSFVKFILHLTEAARGFKFQHTKSFLLFLLLEEKEWGCSPGG